ncbi:MAG: hypothetical protein EXR34_03500 [Rhodoferax sp.]|nr:hypothetical protein [Rhodoferax sp.]
MPSRPWQTKFACLLRLALLLASPAQAQQLTPAPHSEALPQYWQQIRRTDALLLGEQHDAPQHQDIQTQVVAWLAGQGLLAALTLEMAKQGGSTQGLNAQASAAQVQTALDWDERAWPWAAYGPAIMAAVRRGVPVFGTNLSSADLRAAMQDRSLDQTLTETALSTQQQRIRDGHCQLLPERQIAPMTRMQIARDRAMAQTIGRVALAGRTVVLLAGHGHVVRSLGVPQHLSASLTVSSVQLLAGTAQEGSAAGADFDQVWPTGPIPQRDYCAEFKASRPP